MENFNFVNLIKEALVGKKVKLKIGSKKESIEDFDTIKDVTIGDFTSNDEDCLKVTTEKDYTVLLYISCELKAVEDYYDLTNYFSFI